MRQELQQRQLRKWLQRRRSRELRQERRLRQLRMHQLPCVEQQRRLQQWRQQQRLRTCLGQQQRRQQTAVSACEKGGKGLLALELWAGMAHGHVQRSIVTSIVTYRAAGCVCVEGCQLCRALGLLAEMLHGCVHRYTLIYDAAVSACGKGGHGSPTLVLLVGMLYCWMQCPPPSFGAAGSACVLGGKWLLAAWPRPRQRRMLLQRRLLRRRMLFQHGLARGWMWLQLQLRRLSGLRWRARLCSVQRMAVVAVGGACWWQGTGRPAAWPIWRGQSRGCPVRSTRHCGADCRSAHVRAQ